MTNVISSIFLTPWMHLSVLHVALTEFLSCRTTRAAVSKSLEETSCPVSQARSDYRGLLATLFTPTHKAVHTIICFFSSIFLSAECLDCWGKTVLYYTLKCIVVFVCFLVSAALCLWSFLFSCVVKRTLWKQEGQCRHCCPCLVIAIPKWSKLSGELRLMQFTVK